MRRYGHGGHRHLHTRQVHVNIGPRPVRVRRQRQSHTRRSNLLRHLRTVPNRRRQRHTRRANISPRGRHRQRFHQTTRSRPHRPSRRRRHHHPTHRRHIVPNKANLRPRNFMGRSRFRRFTVRQRGHRSHGPPTPTTTGRTTLSMVLPHHHIPPVIRPRTRPRRRSTNRRHHTTFRRFALNTTSIGRVHHRHPNHRANRRHRPPAGISTTRHQLLTNVTRRHRSHHRRRGHFRPFTRRGRRSKGMTRQPARAVTTRRSNKFFRFTFNSIRTLLSLYSQRTILRQLPMHRRQFFNIFTRINVSIVR